MKFLPITILFVSITLAGCASVKTYTFQKDRVDQRLAGNRGYLMGTPPPAPVEREVPKRTLIGVDVEIPILPGEKAEQLSEETPTIEQESIVVEEAALAKEETPVEKTNVTPKKEEGVSCPAGVASEEVIEEEEWVK
ncbi:MAG: hypothetical protein A2Z72_07055 [Omnitrophica bacterium RBG_13_46_9]|nr:MAG: hypothetical protein A2Z72_07055 [Omnitrophica bacterium RBG_13_46_9]